MYLMNGNIPIIKINFSTLRIDILDADLLPVQLIARHDLSILDVNKYFCTRHHLLTKQNEQIVDSYCKEKYPTSLHQDFAKSLLFHGTSMADSFWIKQDNVNITWEQINPRTHELCDICTMQEYLHLEPQREYAQTNSKSQGASKKMWQLEDNEMWLHKQGSLEENQAELLACEILDQTNVPHVQYEKTIDIGCKCKNIVTENYSIVPAVEIYSYCNRNDINYDDFVWKLDPVGYAQMQVIDYLFLNTDRTLENYFFYRDNETGGIIGLTPIMDHNNCFDKNISEEQLHELRKNAVYALKNSQIKFNSKLLFNPNIDREIRQSVVGRMLELGICEKVKYKNHKYNPFERTKIKIQLKPEFEICDDIVLQKDMDRQYMFSEKGIVCFESMEQQDCFQNQFILAKTQTQELTQQYNIAKQKELEL